MLDSRTSTSTTANPPETYRYSTFTCSSTTTTCHDDIIFVRTPQKYHEVTSATCVSTIRPQQQQPQQPDPYATPNSRLTQHSRPFTAATRTIFGKGYNSRNISMNGSSVIIRERVRACVLDRIHKHQEGKFREADSLRRELWESAIFCRHHYIPWNA